jgi:L-lactate dehydrogenase complex protein LldG
MGSAFLEPPAAGDLLEPIRNKIADAKVVCATLPEIGRDHGIARVNAALGTGGCRLRYRPRLLRERRDRFCAAQRRRLGLNALTYLAQHRIVMLDPPDILVNIHHAYTRPKFRSALCLLQFRAVGHGGHRGRTHPRAAQDVRSLSILPAPRGNTNAPLSRKDDRAPQPTTMLPLFRSRQG